MIKISFETIVFNAVSTLPKGMLELCIKNVLPYAHEIFIIEGATKAADGHYWDGNTLPFTKDGRSTDGTIEVISNLEKQYPDKIKVVIGNGFWPGKTSMFNSVEPTGDFVWQLDSDEFYHQIDMEKLIGMLEAWQPHQVEFYANHFFGGFDKVIDETNGSVWGNNIPWRRIFKNIPGRSKWLRHEPPVYSIDGFPNERGFVIDREKTLHAGIKLYHYSYVIRNQAIFKDIFFKQNSYVTSWDGIQNDTNTTIFGVHPKKFSGIHPQIIQENYINIIESNPDASNILETGR